MSIPTSLAYTIVQSSQFIRSGTLVDMGFRLLGPVMAISTLEVCRLSAFFFLIVLACSIGLSAYLARRVRERRPSVAGWLLVGLAAGAVVGAVFGAGSILWNLMILHRL